MRIKTRHAAMLLGLVLIPCAFCLFSCDKNSQLEKFESAQLIYVVDGDTLVVQRENVQGPDYVRLIGIDAPESVHPNDQLNTAEGEAAAQHLKELLPEGTELWLQIDTSDADQYGRLLRYVWVDKPKNPKAHREILSKMLNAMLLKDGWAQAWAVEPDTAYAEYFAQLSEQAAAAQDAQVEKDSQAVQDAQDSQLAEQSEEELS